MQLVRSNSKTEVCQVKIASDTIEGWGTIDSYVNERFINTNMKGTLKKLFESYYDRIETTVSMTVVCMDKFEWSYDMIDRI